MSQQELQFETPLHRERDRPPGIKWVHWSAWIDRVCLRGGVAMTHQALLANFHKCCPEHRDVKAIKDLNVVHLTHWEGWWDRWAPWTKKEGGAT
jgi:hypothetical protein